MGFEELIESYENRDTPFLKSTKTGETIRYSDIRRETSRLRQVLEKAGFRRGTHVAVDLPNSISTVLVYLTLFSSGGVAIPVNPGWKKQELGYILNNAEAEFLLTTPEISADAGPDFFGEEKNGEDRFRDLQIRDLGRKEHTASEEKNAEGEPLTLLLYTSGTTGKPKGVKLTERSLLAEMRHIRDGHGLTSGDTALLVLPMYHINGLVVGMLTPFLTGETLIVPPKFSVSHFWEWTENYGVHWVSAVPTILSMLLARTPETYRGARCLRFVRSASAPLPEAVLREFESRFGVPIVESFGISEGGSQITVNPVDGVRKPGSAGRAYGNEVQVAGENGRELPDGSEGEVRVRGENIFFGYFHRPEETAESLRDGWFYTGDLGIRDADGYFFLTGRKKERINRAGEKFSPREIDEVLYQIPEVEIAAAVGVPDPLYNEKVVAFVGLRPGCRITPEEIRERCRGSLADYKVPEEIFFTGDFPKGPSGKIQRLKLKERYAALSGKGENK